MDIRRELLIQRRMYDGAIPIGPAEQFAVEYADAGADELFVNDCFASVYGRGSLRSIVAGIVDRVFVPVTAAGGIKSIEDASDLFHAGADKIAINTFAAIYDPSIIRKLAMKFGSQAVVVQIDIKDHMLVCCGGRVLVQKNPEDWCHEVVELGAGELFVTNINANGMRSNDDIFVPSVSVPVVVSGGFCDGFAVRKAIEAGADAVAVGRALHEGSASIGAIKESLMTAGVPVRIEERIAC